MLRYAHFDIKNKQSQTKMQIVNGYFFKWIKRHVNLSRKERIAFLDNRAGPGQYWDGQNSTSLEIIKTAVGDPVLSKRLVTIFSSPNVDRNRELKLRIGRLFGLKNLRYQPETVTFDTGSNLLERLNELAYIPTFSFIDPWQYKGIAAQLMKTAIKGRGSEYVFFFDYCRDKSEKIDAALCLLAGEVRGADERNRLQAQLKMLSPKSREKVVLEYLAGIAKTQGGKHVCRQCIGSDTVSGVNRYVFHVTKDEASHKEMKALLLSQIIPQENAKVRGDSIPPQHQGVCQLALPFEIRPVENLCSMLIKDFAGKKMRMKNIYNYHHAMRNSETRKFDIGSYKEALKILERQGRITAQRPSSGRRENTFGDNIVVTFPQKAV